MLFLLMVLFRAQDPCICDFVAAYMNWEKKSALLQPQDDGKLSSVGMKLGETSHRKAKPQQWLKSISVLIYLFIFPPFLFFNFVSQKEADVQVFLS